jgi:uncharacterized protein (DUF305 family)
MPVTRAAAFVFASIIVALPAAAQQAPIVLPGPPGQPPRTITASEASRVADTRYTEADVAFLQAMIVHHGQALDMARLVRSRTSRKDLLDLAGRIEKSQEDEIAFMRGWLRQRKEPLAMPAHTAHHAHVKMAGMASPADLARLAALRGPAFERLFLTLMISHHDGALKMVKDLHASAGSAYDPVLFEFTSELVTDQEAEIERMNLLLAGLSTDPRVGLKAGYRDAGQAAAGLALVVSLPKPPGFFDPANPSGLPPLKPKPKDAAPKPAKAKGEREKPEFSERGPLLSFANTDMAFAGDLMIAGNYHGFNTYRLDANGVPTLLSSTVCPGGQGDISIVGHLMIMSVEQGRGRVDCGLQGVAGDVSAERFRGLRIFDIRDPARPVQVGQVQTCRGSHTHSVVRADDQRILVYNSGTATVRKGDELPGCVGDVPGDPRTALFRIDVVDIPVANPAAARIVATPAVFADPRTGSLAGLWQGGDHGEATQTTSRTDQCHDITVYPTRRIAAGACSGNGILFDIADPLKPRRIDVVSDPGFAYWHSATFNNDGTKVIFTDEWGGGGRARCRAGDPANWGADAIYDIRGNKLVHRAYFKLPAPQSDEENCVAHNGSAVPVPGRDIFVQAWYQGGISVIDFTDSARPTEIAFFDRGPAHRDTLHMAGFWSAYYYRGRIYGTEILRGLDVFSLTPSAHLSANEIAAAALARHPGPFNPQQQFPVTWPDVPVVARAYRDQLARTGALDPSLAAELESALSAADSALAAGRRDRPLGARLDVLARRFAGGPQDPQAFRRSALASALRGIADALR